MARAPPGNCHVITVYGFSPSGNCHKVKLLLEQLGQGLDVDYRWIETDSAHGETRTANYLSKNPNGKVPMLELEDGRLLVESSAILCWLAEGTDFLPTDHWQRAQALRWMFFEQYSHEPYIAVARFICGWTPLVSPRRAGLPVLRQCGRAALAVMEQHLAWNQWFTGDRYGVADIALHAYTCVAPHGGIALDAYPAIRDWLARVATTPDFLPMPAPDAAAQALIDQSA